MTSTPEGSARVSTPIETLAGNLKMHFQPLFLGFFCLLLGSSFLLLSLPAISSDGLRGTEWSPSASTRADTGLRKVAVDEIRKKIAACEYEVYEEANEGLVGPFGEEVRNFHESWTLWQNAKRGYEVEGERRFDSLNKGAQKHNFKVELSRDFTVERITELASLRYVADSGPLTCEFLLKEMHCSPGGKDLNPSRDWHVAVEHPYGLLWPISPFSLGGVTKESERDPAQTPRASLVTIEQPSASEPVSPMVLVGKLQYLGVDDLEAAGLTWRAYKFSIKVPLHPEYRVWTSAKGLLLALSVEHSHADWPKEGLRLARYESFSDY
jgi:hypothetical protein